MWGPTLRCFLCFVLTQIPVAEASGPYFFVVAPNVFRFGYEEEVVISVLGTDGNQTVSLHLEINNGRDVISTLPKSVNVHSDNPENTTVEVKPEHISYENRDDKPRTITLVASSSFAVEQRRVDILLSYDSGYIFIETDKPIYYPRDKVKFRTLCLTEGLEELDKNVTVMVEMIDPKGLVMMREKQIKEKQMSAFYQSEFRMTIHPTTGTWTISVRFAGEYETQVNSTFQVEEYKLPTFGVAISVNESIVHGEKDDGIRIDVKAEYVYKKPVQGRVVLDLFIYNETADGKEGHFILRTRGKLSGGLKEFRISMEDMRLPIEDVWFPEEEKLLVRATVTEDATGAKEVGEHSSTVFSHYLYNVYLTKSRRYYHVGLPYYIQVQVRFINGSIAPFTPLHVTCDECGTKEIDDRTLEDGENAIVFETDHAFKGDLLFEVEVHGQKVALTVQPYRSPHDNFVSMDRDTDHGTPKINVHGSNTNASRYTGLVTLFSSRGTPYQAANGKSIIEINYNEMTKANPSARAIAFYVDTRTDEVVADSMRLAMENKCQRELTLNLNNKGRLMTRPGYKGELTINGEGEMYVGIKFMDKAVLYRNNKNILQPLSLFRKLDQHDLGCGQGGGTDSVSVFQNAGMTVVTNAALRIPQRENAGCPKSNQRKRRSAGHEQVCGKGDECCKHGQTLADGFKRDYEDNKEDHVGAEALPAALKQLRLECFQKAYDLRANNTRKCISSVYYRCMDSITFHFEDNYSVSRFLGDDTMEYITDLKDAEIQFRSPRSNFDESFLFQLKAIHDTDEITFTYPDSITEWMVSAIGFSKQYGVCITDSVNITTFKELFVHLDLPYSAVRLEHVDVKATVFNYDSMTKNVSLYMEGVSDVCSNAEPGQHTQRKLLTLQANSAQTVRFPIIPLKAGPSGNENKFEIIVKAIDVSSGIGDYDYIKKSLYVKNEGVLVTKKIQVCLDPQNISENCQNTPDITIVSHHMIQTNGNTLQMITITLTPPPNITEGSEYALARITSNNVMVEAVDTILNGVGGLIRKAIGCGEQTMVLLAPGVYAMNYLKKTGTLTSEYETSGNQYIPDGIRRILTFRKDDGSYAVWSKHSPSSTWLTAFVLKVFCQADEVVSDPVVKEEHVTPGIQWLKGKQNEGGEFREDKVYRGKMIGQLTMDNTSLTAFVLIAMSECTSRDYEISQSAVNAKTLLEKKDLDSLTDYQVAIITYALALTKSNERYNFKNRLLAIITQVQGMSYIGNSGDANSASAGSIETTSYALLALLKFDELQMCNKLVNWLMLHRNSGGSFKTTQTTVVGLQALSEYNIKTFHSEVDLKIRIAGNKGPVTKLTPQNSMVPKLHVNLMKYLNKKHELFVTVDGTGKGLFLIDYRYNRKPNEDEVCDFEVTSIDPKKSTDTDHPFGKCSNEDDLIQEQAINHEYDAVEPVPQRTERKRRHAQNVDMHYCVSFNVSTKASGESAPTGMSVVDFEIQTGLTTVHESDFQKMVQDRVIQSYDMPSSGDGFIIFYLEDISAKPREITFRLKDEGTTTRRQSAMVTVYDYYNPDKKCSTFYNVGFRKDKAVDKLCPMHQAECRCLFSECSSDYLSSETFRPYRLYLDTCTKAEYGVIVKILAVRNREQPGYIEAEAHVTRVLKTGSEVDLKRGATMVFYWRELCSLPDLKKGTTYVIVANEGTHRTVDKKMIYDYPLMHGAIFFERMKANTKVGKLITRYVNLMKKGCRQ